MTEMVAIQDKLQKPEDLPSNLVMQHPLVQELSDSQSFAGVKVPFIIKDRKLMDSGIWNGMFYSDEAIEQAFISTDWNERSVNNLFLDHEDNRTRDWVGEVKNIHQRDGKPYGDLYIHDPVTAVKLSSGKPKIGISPRVHAKFKDDQIMNFVFENFSLVMDPAVKSLYINNSQQEVRKLAEGSTTEKVKPQETEEEAPVKSISEQTEQKTSENTKTEKNANHPPTQKPEDEPDEDEDEDKKEKMKNQESEIDKFSTYVKEMRETDPKLSLEEMAQSFRKRKLAEKIADLPQDKLEAIYREQFSVGNGDLEKENSELKEKVETMSEKIQKLQERINKPDPVGGAEAAASTSEKTANPVRTKYASSNEAMMEYVREVGGIC